MAIQNKRLDLNIRLHKTKQASYAHSPSTEHTKRFTVPNIERGAVFTRREVTEFILDIAGYTVEFPLYEYRLLEPAFGNGDFLLPIVERLLSSYKSQFSSYFSIVKDLSDSIFAVEIHKNSFDEVHAKLQNLLRQYGVADIDALRLLKAWIKKDDFLLLDLPHNFTHAIGNPPYVRQENIPDNLLTEYRKRYATIYDRADLYIPFIERCLSSLEFTGTLAFICADRWMKNKYGKPLREMVHSEYHLVCYVDMVDTPAFQSEVSAYPAITIIKREKGGPTRIAHRPQVNRNTLKKLARNMLAKTIAEGSGIMEVIGVVKDNEPWILQSFDQLAIVRRLEKEFPLLEEAGCKVGIGVATGLDKVFIGPLNILDVEDDRKLPLVRTRDIESGKIEWQGLGVINPFLDDGSLADLRHYPRLSKYLRTHMSAIRRRNCAKKNPKNWYRTIDRIYPELANRPKLLIPDIKGDALVVYEDGHFYPHHNLYYIVSDEWDLMALQAVLRSGIAKLFVSIYSTQMRGGYLRFQAQYLRRIRLPRWKDIRATTRKTLLKAAKRGDFEACNRAAFELYRLTPEERTSIGGNGN